MSEDGAPLLTVTHHTRRASNRTTLNIRQSVPGRDIIPDDRTSSVTCHTFDTGDDTNQQNPAG